ncbi:hypothetical protein HYH02_011266 [Chlamydomonas schloesseri]|uniref:Uncharacterized protein n=1 Tax=Chlamydomonas schloesseri TaxID=2026947 RepID=A0A835T5Z2_9CHLO|nr:hypothetical protein HYH02_011266 [Chlamydomonas schloesseri]|eukprot:KAG2437627.1 hypothetical protein HYH02_011266 [Chlamydomonas schloesseri]
MLILPDFMLHSSTSYEVTSLNPDLSMRNTALRTCKFAPFTELHAMSWTGQAQLDWSAEYVEALGFLTNGNQLLPRGWLPPVPEPVSARLLLPDTLRRLTIRRTRDERHGSVQWTSRPLITGPLPAEWALFRNLEYLDLSDEMETGQIVGPIPSTWLMMTHLRVINMTGHHNFCKDWHKIVSWEIRLYYGDANEGRRAVPHYYGPWGGFNKNATRYNISIYDLNGHGWQWYDEVTGTAGYVNVIAPHGKCCWDIWSQTLRDNGFEITNPNGTSRTATTTPASDLAREMGRGLAIPTTDTAPPSTTAPSFTSPDP